MRIAGQSEEELRKAVQDTLLAIQRNSEAQQKAAQQEERTAEAEEDAAHSQEEAAKKEEGAAEKEGDAAEKEGDEAGKSKKGRFKNIVQGGKEKARNIVNKVKTDVNTFGGEMSGAKKHFNAHGVKYFFFAVLLLHLLDIDFFSWVGISLGGYRHVGYMGAVWAMIYAVVAVVALFVLANGWRDVFGMPMITYLLLSTLAWFLPKIISYLPDVVTGNLYFKFALILSPVWGIYLLFNSQGDSLLDRMKGWWISIWAILLIVSMLGLLSETTIPQELQGEFQFNAWDTIKEVLSNLWESLKNAFSRLFGIVPAIQAAFLGNLNDTLGTAYRGEIDPYSSSNLGVRITNLRAQDKRLFVNQPAVVWVELEGESYQEEILLTLRCYAKDQTGTIIDGVIDAQGLSSETNQLTFSGKQFTSASCTFASLPVKGWYDIFVTGTFNFETWSYIPYYFSPANQIQQMWREDINPAEHFGIPSKPVAIYNEGPISLGLASEAEQPISIDITKPNQYLPAFGATIENTWLKGEVVSVRYIKLLTPPTFSLRSCDRDPKQGTRAEPIPSTDEATGYRVYEFTNIKNLNTEFQSVTCLLQTTDFDALEMLGDFDIVLKTFVAKTGYIYSITNKLRVNVE